ncbi:MAG TPA: threonine-phosphate decarboxylase CobD [Candidatus Acidoferrales bacterium]|nr:threonine-phosphate decarboxylase CobD [Candidatus Acidoferrales bacterium]
MTEHSPARAVHGGDIESAVERYGGDPNTFLDFSSNINPLGPPEAVLEFLREHATDARLLGQYPDPEYRSLRRTISAHERIPIESVVVANGSAALFDAIIRTLRPQSCLVPIPAFSEYSRALDAAGVTVIPFALDAASHFTLDVCALSEAIEQYCPNLCIITNPHNPSGNLIKADDLRALTRQAQAFNVTCVVDEAFIDYAPGETLTRDVPVAGNIIVIRSFTKFYAIPGLRVGYAVVAPSRSRALCAQLPAWPISTLAAEASMRALPDATYADLTRTLNEQRRTELARSLTALALRSFPAHANFILIGTGRPSAPTVHRLAGEHRILVRNCDTFEGLAGAGYLRVAVRSKTDNDCLVRALADVLI